MNGFKASIANVMVLCTAWLMWGCSQDVAVTEQPPFVMVEQPKTANSSQQSYAGIVQARQETALAFRVGGQVVKRLADVGDRVEVGQVLAELDVKDAELQRLAAKASLESAEASLKHAEGELKRFQQLLPINAVSRSQFDTIQQQHKAALAAVNQAKASYDVAKNQTQYNQLIAHKQGVITQRQVEVGQVIAAGQPAYQMAISNAQDVVIGVPEQKIGELKKGQTAWVRLWSQPDQNITASIREISPSADQSRTFHVKVALPPTQGVQLGQSARVFLQQNEHQHLTIPLSSVSASDQNAYVMVVNANHIVRKVPVQIGAYGRDHVSIISGLSTNDYVVVGGIHLLRDKQKVKPIDRDNRAVNIAAGVK